MTDMLVIAGWCFAVSLVLPLFVWALMPLLPRCAATRHLVWLTLFAVLLVLPALALVVPSHMVFSTGTEAAPATAPDAVVLPHGRSAADAVPYLILAWLAGILFHLGRLGLGLFGLHRLRRASVPFDGAQDVRLADEGPLAFGVFRPLILLPHEADNWPLARLVAVLAHERAHLKRRDSLTQMLAQLVCAFYWPNVLLWLGARRLRQEAEIAADNAALAGGIRASDYAAELLQLAGQSLRLPAAAMAAPSLEARVKSVLSPDPSRGGARAIDAFKIIWLGSAAAVALAFVRPAIAQDSPAPPAAPVAQAAPAAPAPAAPAAPEAQPAPVAPTARPAHRHHHPVVRIDSDGLTPDEQARIDAATAQVRDTMEAMRPQIERAAIQASSSREAMLAVQGVMPQVHAAIAQAMAQIRPMVHQAFVDARVDVKVSVALDHAQAQIDAAVAHAEQEAERDADRAERQAARAAHAAERARAHEDAPADINP